MLVSASDFSLSSSSYPKNVFLQNDLALIDLFSLFFHCPIDYPSFSYFSWILRETESIPCFLTLTQITNTYLSSVLPLSFFRFSSLIFFQINHILKLSLHLNVSIERGKKKKVKVYLCSN